MASVGDGVEGYHVEVDVLARRLNHIVEAWQHQSGSVVGVILYVTLGLQAQQHGNHLLDREFEIGGKVGHIEEVGIVAIVAFQELLEPYHGMGTVQSA